MNMSETSTTINSRLSTACAPLFKCLPIVTRQDNKIIIYNLPATLSYDTLDKSSIIDICHQMKHLYSDGDRIGRKGIAKKKHLENNTIRMCISYTYSLRRESESTVLTINFMPSFTEHHLPRFIQRVKKSDLTPKEFEEMKAADQIVSSTRKSVTIERNMNEYEIAEQMDVFVGTCREEICELVKKTMDIAFEQATISVISDSTIAFA